MKVYWTDTAVQHLLAVYEYIGQDTPIYAQRVIDRIIQRSEQIMDFPQSGRMVPEYEEKDVREIIEKPYRIIYRIRSDQVDILAVVHGARSLPSEL